MRGIRRFAAKVQSYSLFTNIADRTKDRRIALESILSASLSVRSSVIQEGGSLIAMEHVRKRVNRFLSERCGRYR